jgi:hypothetical protein
VVSYVVTCDFDRVAVADAWERWLREQHAGDVVAAGALSADVVRVHETRIECRYRFASRDAFAAYERDHAPRLRAEGLARVPPEGGVRLSRAVNEV